MKLADLEKLASIANSLDSKGLTKEADQLDALIESFAFGDAPEDKYAITLKHEVKVPDDVFQQYTFPDEIPAEKHTGVKTTLVVNEREGYNIGKELEKKEFSSKNLDEARSKADAPKREMESLYPSSTSDEEIYFV